MKFLNRLTTLAVAALALAAPTLAEAAAKVRVEWVQSVAQVAPNQPASVYGGETLTVTTAQSTAAAPSFGSPTSGGFARVTVLSGAAVVLAGETPVATETTGVRLEAGQEKLIAVRPGWKVSAIEAADAPSSAALPAGAATAANQTSANTKLDQLHADFIAPTPAGELHIGEVGGNAITIPVAQTVTASSAYASGQAIGGLITLSNAARVAGGSGLIQSVLVDTKSAQTTSTDVVLFSANPSASTCTDKTAFSVAAADFDKVIGVAHVTDWTSLGTPSVGQAQNLAVPFALTSGSTIYACAVTRGTPTFSSTSDVTVAVRILRN
jgi:hypothetical protein